MGPLVNMNEAGPQFTANVGYVPSAGTQSYSVKGAGR